MTVESAPTAQSTFAKLLRPLSPRGRGAGERGSNAIARGHMTALALGLAMADGMHWMECHVNAPSPRPSPARGEGDKRAAKSRGHISHGPPSESPLKDRETFLKDVS